MKRLTESQRARLQELADGHPFGYGVRGLSQHGGAHSTMVSLLQQGLMEHGPDGKLYITDWGRKRLTAYACPARRCSVSFETWATADTAECPACGSTVAWRPRETDLSPYGVLRKHLTDGTLIR